jgi:hypothetical protein
MQGNRIKEADLTIAVQTDLLISLRFSDLSSPSGAVKKQTGQLERLRED